MIRVVVKIRTRYYLPLTVSLIGILSVAAIATAARFSGIDGRKDQKIHSMRAEQYVSLFDVVHEQRVRFAADHGVDDPAALVAAVRHSPMANLLISIAIEESRGDPVAVGSAGEQGAWQVKPASWGLVPQDIHGQASQAERIIHGLLVRSKGNKIQALAHYNGGSAPPDKSYRYAKRILKRAGHLHVTVNVLPPDFHRFRETLLDPSDTVCL